MSRDYRRAHRADWSRFWSEVWRERRALGIARRRDAVAERLTDPPELPRPLADVLEECRAEFTARQVEALVYRYGYGLSLQEAADALGIKKQTFRKRLDRANRRLNYLTGAYAAWATNLRDEAGHLLDLALSPDRVADHLWPLIQRQRRWERTVDRLWGLTPRSTG